MSIFDQLKKGIRCMTPETTIETGRIFAEALPANQVVALSGELGAGKTTFTKGLGQALGVATESITSPTFNIYKIHQGIRQLVHIDGYRLADKTAAEELLIEEFLVDPWLIAVEWPERALADWMNDVLWQLRFERTQESGLLIRHVNLS
jgi:tRNA threonylcarbamoyladenosine biosynthesis protein TsaE